MTTLMKTTPFNIELTFRGLHRNDKQEMIEKLAEVILEIWEDMALELPREEISSCWQKDFIKHFKVNAKDWGAQTKDHEFIDLLVWIAGVLAEEKVNDQSVFEINYSMLNVTLYSDKLLSLVKDKHIE